MVNLLNISYSESGQTTHDQLYMTNRPTVVVTHQTDPIIKVAHQPDLVTHQPDPTIVVAH